MQLDKAGQNEALRYLRLFWNWKWLIVPPAILCGVGAAFYSMRLPDRFRSSTVILVTPQKVPENFVSSTVTTDIQDRLDTIRQQILSRTRLEKIIEEFRLFEAQRDNKVPMEALVGLMRDRVSVTVQRGRGTQAFEVSYSDPSPVVAMRVTNKIASLFIEENLKVREQQAIGTSQFLSDEIEDLRDRIAKRDKAITEFRRENMDELPDRMASNQSRLAQLQSQLQMNVQNVNAAEDRKVLLRQQMSEIERRFQAEAEARAAAAFSSGNEDRGSPAVLPQQLSAEEQELARARNEMDRLRLRYTEKHPDVVALAGRIARLEAEVASRETAPVGEAEGAASGSRQGAPVEGRGAPGSAPTASAAQGAPPLGEYPPVYYQLRNDIQSAELETARLREENKRMAEEVEKYQKRLAATPIREMELSQLSQDYESLKVQLDRLVENKLRADLSENLERKQKGEQFQILDPANLPVKPIAPNRVRLVGAGFAAGGGIGAAIVFLLDLLATGPRSRDELSELLGVPVVGVISEIVTPGDIRRRRVTRLALSFASLACVVLLAGVVHWTVSPLPRLAQQIYQQARSTHWTAMR